MLEIKILPTSSRSSSDKYLKTWTAEQNKKLSILIKFHIFTSVPNGHEESVKSLKNNFST